MSTGDITKQENRKRKKNIYIYVLPNTILYYNVKGGSCKFYITALNKFDLKQQDFLFYN